MRVLYLHQYFTTPEMCGGTRSYEMARRLVASGHEVHMITADRNGTGRGQSRISVESGIKVHWLPVSYSNYMSYANRISAFMRFALKAASYAAHIPADLVFATSTPLTIALPGVYAARRHRIPMVFEVRDLWPEVPIAVGALRWPMSTLARYLERFAYHNSAQIVALSPGIKKGVVRRGYPADRVHVIPNGADLELFAVPPERGHRFRRKLPWLRERSLVVYAGSIGRINGVDYLVKLAAHAIEVNPETCFLVVGDGFEREKVVNMAKRLGVFERNCFFFPPLPKAQIPDVLSAADVFFLFFVDLRELWANSANKFFDALAAGRPVAINYSGWQAELLLESSAGIVLDANDVRGAAGQLLGFLDAKARLRAAGLAARRLAETRFSRDKLAAELEALFMMVLDCSC